MTENFEHFAKRCKWWGWKSTEFAGGCDWCNKPAHTQVNLFFGIASTRLLCREHYNKLIREFDRIEKLKEGSKRRR